MQLVTEKIIRMKLELSENLTIVPLQQKGRVHLRIPNQHQSRVISPLRICEKNHAYQIQPSACQYQCTHKMVEFRLFVIKILSRNDILTSFKSHIFVRNLRKMTGKNAYLDLGNINAYTNVVVILSI